MLENGQSAKFCFQGGNASWTCPVTDSSIGSAKLWYVEDKHCFASARGLKYVIVFLEMYCKQWQIDNFL